MSTTQTPTQSPVLQISPLGFPWTTIDPFLFCVYHNDAYPKANAQFGPATSLTGRNIGQDFSRKDGWNMYHGTVVPGFPAHPHRGFETVTIVRKGLIDHSDSLGAAARFGRGDVQWLTAGRGIVHSEMFPLLDESKDNPVELFQIWLNLPAKKKMAPPHFTMFWADKIPGFTHTDANGGKTDVSVVAGKLDAPDAKIDDPLSPPPDSYASQDDSDLAIWTLKMTPNARWTLPAATGASTRRNLYFFAGKSVNVGGTQADGHSVMELAANVDVEIVNGPEFSELLVLQGRPIAEPVVQYGPFVMNTRAEIEQTFSDYQRTQFGGWPWEDQDPVHGDASTDRFAKHADGKTEEPVV